MSSLASMSGTDGSPQWTRMLAWLSFESKESSLLRWHFQLLFNNLLILDLAGRAYALGSYFGFLWSSPHVDHGYSFGEDQLSFERFPATWAIQPYDNPGQSVPSTYVSFAFYYRTPGKYRQHTWAWTGDCTAASDNCQNSFVPMESSLIIKLVIFVTKTLCLQSYNCPITFNHTLQEACLSYLVPSARTRILC